MGLDKVDSGAVIVSANSTNNLILLHAWDFIAVDPADDNIIVEVQALDGKAEFRILGSIDEEEYPGTGLGTNGEWFVIHGDTRLTASTGEAFSNTYTKHPFMAVVVDNPTPNPVTVQVLMYGRDSIGDPASIPVTVANSWGTTSIANINTVSVGGVDVEESCTYFAAAAIDDSNNLALPVGLGLTWTQVDTRSVVNDIRLTVWKGTGTPSGLGEVTFSVTSGNVSWAANVTCVKKADQADPVLDFCKGTGTNDLPQTDSNCNTDPSSLFLVYTAFDSNSAYTAADGTISVREQDASNQVRLKVRSYSPTDGNPREGSGELSTASDWAVIGVAVRRV